MLLILCWLIGLVGLGLKIMLGSLSVADFLSGVLFGIAVMGAFANALMTEEQRQRPLNSVWRRHAS